MIGDVRGLGLMLGIDLVKDRESKEPATERAGRVVERCRELGVLMGTDGPYDNVDQAAAGFDLHPGKCRSPDAGAGAGIRRYRGMIVLQAGETGGCPRFPSSALAQSRMIAARQSKL